MREIVLDTETTGLDAKGDDRIVEIGCVELLNYIPTGKEWHCYINPERDMPTAAFEVHGLSEAFLADKPLFADIADEFLDFIGTDRLVIHNAAFDFGFLNAELTRAERGLLNWEQVVDSLTLARRRHPGAPCSLDALCKRYGVDLSARDKHGALLDCQLLAAVYVELVGGHQARLELGVTAAAEAAAYGDGTSRTRPQPLPSRLSEAEMTAHEAFLDELGAEPLWASLLGKGKA